MRRTRESAATQAEESGVDYRRPAPRFGVSKTKGNAAKRVVEKIRVRVRVRVRGWER